MITQLLKNRRLELGLTQEELAERCNESIKFHRNDISRYERSSNDIPLHKLEVLCKALELKIEIKPIKK